MRGGGPQHPSRVSSAHTTKACASVPLHRSRFHHRKSDAFPSRGIGDPAARLAGRGPDSHLGGLGPGGEIGGGIAVSVDDQPATAQGKTRSVSRTSWLTFPQREQVLVDGNHRSASTSSAPNQAAL